MLALCKAGRLSDRWQEMQAFCPRSHMSLASSQARQGEGRTGHTMCRPPRGAGGQAGDVKSATLEGCRVKHNATAAQQQSS